MMFGYADGSVSFHEMEEVDEENINRRTNQIKNEDELRASNLVVKKCEHKESILSLDSCISKRLFLTCRYEIPRMVLSKPMSIMSYVLSQ